MSTEIKTEIKSEGISNPFFLPDTENGHIINASINGCIICVIFDVLGCISVSASLGTETKSDVIGGIMACLNILNIIITIVFRIIVQKKFEKAYHISRITITLIVIHFFFFITLLGLCGGLIYLIQTTLTNRNSINGYSSAVTFAFLNSLFHCFSAVLSLALHVLASLSSKITSIPEGSIEKK